jgi:hypothetical protein
VIGSGVAPEEKGDGDGMGAVRRGRGVVAVVDGRGRGTVMAKLTKLQRQHVDRALYHAKRAHAYLFANDTVICRRAAMATTTLHYVRSADGAAVYEVGKCYGSDLCGLDDAIKELTRLYEGEGGR